MNQVFRHIALFLVFAVVLLVPTWNYAQDSVSAEESQAPVEEKEAFDAKSFIFGHTGDAYCFHVTEIKGKPICVWLPVIVKCKDGGDWHCFSSKHVCELKEGETYEHKGARFYVPPINASQYPGKLVEVKADGSLSRPFDISFTKNAFGIFLVCGFMLAFFLPAARKYRKDPMATPTKYQGLVEWLTYMVFDGIIRPNIPEKKVNKFAPYLLTVFFFIFFANLFGLIPFFPFSANVTGNLSITIVLALLTFFFVNVFGNKHYWKDIFWPDVPIFLKVIPLMPIIELISVIIKPFALMVRLFANILAGHIVILVLMGLIFIIGGMYGAGMGSVTSVISIFMTVFMFAMELMVAYIQAYVFTILSAVFIGLAQQEPEHS
ncbi:MAG: F0F1 ATP synthase subunit A [Bacteroidales bacterium]|nr:F0F1 ATP synthase subunit A [Bacteroidales bacterium]